MKRMPWSGALPVLLALVAAAALGRTPAYAATIVVTTTADELNADGDCSLREALEAANQDLAVDACPAGSGADTITLPAGIFTLTRVDDPATFDDDLTTGDLDIIGDLTLSGAGTGVTTIDAAGLDRAIAVWQSPTATIANLSVTGGSSGVRAGSGIWVSSSTLTLDRVRVFGNEPQGGIFIIGTSSLTLTGSRIDQNIGSGIVTQSTTTLTVINSVISGNTNDSNGGGIDSTGTTTIVNSVISGNATEESGGGIDSTGTTTIVNSTISGNRAEKSGGGVNMNFGTTSLYNVTIAANMANNLSSSLFGGGGVAVNAPGALAAQNALIAGNQGDRQASGTSHDCLGTITSGGYNLIEQPAGCTLAGNTAGNISGQNPALGPLQNNGGGTSTHGLALGSPAIDAGNPLGCVDGASSPLTLDQRGVARTSRCDIGAYEASASTPTSTPTSTRTATSTSTRTATSTSTRTATSTSTPTATAMRTPVDGQPPSTPTATSTSTPTATAMRTPVDGQPPSTPTATSTSTPTATAMRTPVDGQPPSTPTATSTSTPTATATATRTAVDGQPTGTPQATPGVEAPEISTATPPAASQLPQRVYLPLVHH